MDGHPGGQPLTTEAESTTQRTNCGSNRSSPQELQIQRGPAELDKALGLNLVPASVERLVSGRPASLTWWLDNVAMDELDRRRKRIDPPDGESWNRQMQAVRVFDKLIFKHLP